MTLAIRIVAGVAAAALIAALAYRSGSLSRGGAIAAIATGTAAVAAGWDWAVLLLAYFAVSTLLSRAGRKQKALRTRGMIAKPGARDAWQVLSNGFPFLLAASAAAFAGDSSPWLMAVGAGGLAASAADTWATEIGTLVGQTPRSIMSGRLTAIGESGGITLAGTAAALAGAIFIGIVAVGVKWPPTLFVPIAVAGVAGALVDSVIGATVQRRSWCDACDQATEMRLHSCGKPARLTGGVGFIENDAVNLTATIAGAAVAALALRVVA